MVEHGTPRPGLRYPMEPIRDRYVTPFGGVSYELGAGEVGVNAEALAANTSLGDAAEVMVAASTAGGRPFAPGSQQGVPVASYRLVPLAEDHPDALRWSPQGEVVFSSFDDGQEGLAPWLRPGDTITLNASLTRFPVGIRRLGEAI